MLRSCLLLILLGGLVVILNGCVLAAQLGLTSLTDTPYDLQGVQAGQAAPSTRVYSTDGRRLPLAEFWSKRPLLIVNGSYTCPVARLNNPGLGKLQARYAGRLAIVVLYVYEPHPKGDPSPYTGKEWVTFSNILAGIIYRQPRTLSERLVLARQFEAHIEGTVPVLVDDMNNKYWTAVGGGPNTALLVDVRGQIIAKQGWYHQKRMQAIADEYFGIHDDERASSRAALKPGPR